MKINFSTMTDTERSAHIEGLDNDGLAAALSQVTEQGTALFAKTSPTVDEVKEGEVLLAARDAIKAAQADRAKIVKDAEERFAAAREAFSVNDGVETGDDEVEAENAADEVEANEPEESDEDAEDEGSDDGETVEAAKGENPFDKKKKPSSDEEDPKKTMTASGAQRVNGRKATAASKVAARTKRPVTKETSPVTIVASADVPGLAAGSVVPDLASVAKGLIGRVKGFAPHNPRAAAIANEASGGAPVLSQFGVASFGLNFSEALVASGNEDQNYGAIQAAVREHSAALTASLDKDEALTAAAWCAPSEVAYNWLADYVVDGLLTTPQVSAPRGGLMTTTGPALADQYAGSNLGNFGWTHTEAMSEAGTVKTCETIICPEFEDHRLDAVGYCWKIPILTQKAYPELITDALRLSSVLYAHKQNARFIADSLALSVSVTPQGLGASFTDTLEALTILAVKERRKWNLGENAVMEVKMPVWAKEVFRADLSRRPFLNVSGPITDAQIISEFTSRRLAPEFVSDWAELTGANPVFPATFPVMVYPAGTFVKAVEDVINLSAVYDAASLSVNEYTGVFFEQGVMLFKAGYGSTKFTIPVCTAGLVGAPILDCHTDSTNYAGQKTAVVA